MKNAVINTCLSIVSIIVALLLVEGAAQIYVDKIEMKGKLFEPDTITGWKVRSLIDMQRKNADGRIWTIKTDTDGFRGDSYWDSNKNRVLILGDSFAFGEGVDLEDRFDTIIKKHGYSVLNTGVMGYGTDQQFLKAEPYLSQMNNGDVVIVLTYYNDFYDILRKQHSGRAKPWYDINIGGLQIHKPEITLREVLRDKSYIYAQLGSFLAKQHEASDSDIIHASDIYQMIMEKESQKLISKGVHFMVAYHGIPVITNVKHRNQIVRTLNTICENSKIHCLNIDEHFDVNTNGNYFLADGHWNSKGHEMVGALLAEKLSGIVQH